MDVVVALHAAAAVLAVVAGAAKIVRPLPTAELFGSLGLPEDRRLPALLGGAEVVVGVGALAVGGSVAAVAVGVLYTGFAVVVVRALAVGAESCGCFGRAEAPPSWIHVVGNLAFATVSFVAAAADTPVEVMDGQPAAGIGFVVLVGVIAGLALVAFTALPEALAARQGSTSLRLHEREERSA